MDFLNPHFRRRHRRRLIVGYSLFAIALISGTIALALMASGLGITKSGTIVHHGLMFIDSRPNGAKITINGTPHDKTSARILLPARTYDIVLSKQGFHDWSRQFNLKDQQVISLTYPLLIPQNMPSKIIQTYTTMPGMIVQSPDHHWLLVGGQVPASGQASLELIDTLNPNTAPQTIILPNGLLTRSKGLSSLSFIQWGADNYHVLLLHQFNGQSEYISLDRGRPADSLNLTRKFGQNFTDVRYANTSADQYYLYNSNLKSLVLATNSNLAVAPRFSGVLVYHVLSANRLIYVKTSTLANKADVRIWENGRDYLLARLPLTAKFLVDGVSFQGSWYYAASATGSNQVTVYKNPISYLSQVPSTSAKPLARLTIDNVQQLSFSPNARFLYLPSSQNITVYDVFNDEHFMFQVGSQVQPNLAWLDSYHFGTSYHNQAYIADYDGLNQQQLAPTALWRGGFLSSDSHYFLTLVNSINQTGYTLKSLNLQPKIPLTTTNN